MKISSKEITDTLVALGFISKVSNKYYSTDLFSKLGELKELYQKSNVELSEDELKKAKELDFKSKTLTAADLYSEEYKAWVIEWNKKFPSPTKSLELINVKKNFRSGLSGTSGVQSKMMHFIVGSEFKYNLNVIDVATDLYIYREYENNQLRYLMQSGNFIHKQEVGSKLESECEALLEDLESKNILQEDLHLHLNSNDTEADISNDSINRNIDTEDGWTFINA